MIVTLSKLKIGISSWVVVRVFNPSTPEAEGDL